MKHQFLTSEISELERLLASIPAGNLIERLSLEARLESAMSALAALPVEHGTGYARTVATHPPTRGATLGEIFTSWDRAENPVTRSVFRGILASRLDALERAGARVGGS
jgi:hypothetical protein